MTWDFRRGLHDEEDLDGEEPRRRPAPGKVTLTSHLPAVQRRAAAPPAALDGVDYLAQPVQRRAPPTQHEDPFSMHLISTPVQRSGDGAKAEDVHTAAARGLDAPASSLPHLDTIQKSFGHHDVSHVQAHVGGAAAEASAAMGASAYASGAHVAFAGAPDLHTAAHEAAHTVQQKGGVQLKGGVGEEGDAYEQHADTVADKVVAGESAEALLDQMAGIAGTHGGDAADAVVQQKKGGGAGGPGDPPRPAGSSRSSEVATAAAAVSDAADFAQLELASNRAPDAKLVALNEKLRALADALHVQAGDRPAADDEAVRKALRDAQGVANKLHSGHTGRSPSEDELRAQVQKVTRVLTENTAREATLESPGALAGMVEQSLAVLNEWKAFGENNDNIDALPGLSARALEEVIATTKSWAAQLASDPGAAASLSRAIVDQHEIVTMAGAELRQILKQPISATTKDTIHAYFAVLALSTERRQRSDKALDLARAKRRRLPLDRAESALEAGMVSMLELEQRDPEAGGKARAAHTSLARRHSRMEAQIGADKAPTRGEVDDLVLETRDYEFLHRVDLLALQAKQALDAINQVRSPRTAEKVKIQRKLDELVASLAGVRRRYKEFSEPDFYASPGEARATKQEALRVMEAQLQHQLTEDRYDAALDEAKAVLDDQIVDQFLSQLLWTVALTISGNFVAAAARGGAGAMAARMGASLTTGARVANVAAIAAEGTYGAVTQKYLQGDPGSLTTLLAVNILTPFAIDRVMGLARTAERVTEGAADAAAKSERLLDDAAKVTKVDDVALDADEVVSLAARIDRAAKKSVWVKHARTGALGLRGGVNLTAEMIMGAAVDYATRRAMNEGGRPPTDQTAAEWLMQGASMAIGRHMSVNVRAIRNRLHAVEGGAAGAVARILKVADTVGTDAQKLEAGGPADAAPDVVNRYARLMTEEQAFLEKELADTIDGRGHHSRKKLLALLAGNRRATSELGKLASGELATDGGPVAAGRRRKDDGASPGRRPARGADRSTPAATDRGREPIMLVGDDHRLRDIARGVKPLAGYLDVVVHGDAASFTMMRTSEDVTVDQRAFASYVKRHGWTGQKIRLISCETGKHAQAIAVHLANKLDTEVLAPSDIAWIHGDGTMTVGHKDRDTGEWVPFKPDKNARVKRPESLLDMERRQPSDPEPDYDRDWPTHVAPGRNDERARATSATEAELSRLLGAQAMFDDTLDIGVEVHARKRQALLRFGYDVHVRVGRNALLTDVLVHRRTVEKVERYNGIVGGLRKLADRFEAWFAKRAGKPVEFPPHSIGWVAKEELLKLDVLLASRGVEVGKGKVNDHILDEEIAFLQGRRDFHESAIESLQDADAEADDFIIGGPGEGKVTAQALAAGYKLPDVDHGVLPEWYYYRHKRNVPDEFELVKKLSAPSDAPSLQVRVVGGKFVGIEKPTKREAAEIPDDMSPGDAVKHMREHHGIEEFGNMLEVEGLATRDVMDGVIGHVRRQLQAKGKGVQTDKLRHLAKDQFRERIRQRLLDPTLTDQQSWKRMREMLDMLTSSDRGNLAEEWFIDGHAPDAERHVGVGVTRSGGPNASKIEGRVIDAVDGDTAIEIKDVTGKIDTDQLNAYLDMLEAKLHQNAAGATPPKIKRVKYVFTKPEGAIANLESFAALLSRPDFQGKLTVDVFDFDGRRHVVTSPDQARALHSQLLRQKGASP